MKKNVTDVSQPFEVVATNAKNIKVVDASQGNLSPLLRSESRKIRDVEEEVADESAGDFVSSQDVLVDSSTAAVPEHSILLAQADVAPRPYTIYITDSVEAAQVNAEAVVAPKSAGIFSGVSNWWMGGLGVAAVATGVGLSSSGGGSANGPVNTAPEFTSGAIGSVDENAPIGTIIYDADATDVDAGTTITYSLKPATGDVAALNINASTGEVTLKVSADFEIKSSYSFTVIASDGTNSSEKAVIVSVNDVNEAPVIISPNSGNPVFLDINEGIATVATVVATDIDAGQTITYSLSGADSTLFTINSIDGTVTFTTAPVYIAEGDNTYNFTVIAKDNGTDELSDQQDFSVTIIDLLVNPPIFSSGGTGNIDENALASTVVYSANATGDGTIYSLKDAIGDTDLVSINSSTGEVTLNSSANFESKATYNFTVVANNNGAIAEQPVIITVNDINDAPTTTAVTLAAILEDSSARLITQAELLINAFDDDGDDLTATNLAITSGGGTLVYNGNDTWSYTPVLNDDTSVSFSYKITDGVLISDGSATLDITPVNDAPIITSNGGGSTANVSVAATRTAVTTVIASDVDSDNLSYFITDAMDGALFDIDSVTGVLTFKVAPEFIESTTVSDNTYDIQVTVSDGYLTDVQDITVYVTNYKNVVVESGVAYIDLNGNGFKDPEDTIFADFTLDTGNVDLVLNPVVIHFNNAISLSPLNLTGFGSDDRIEVDVQAFIDKEHNALNILAVSGIKTLDNFRTAERGPLYRTEYSTPSSAIVKNVHILIGDGEGTFYSNSISYNGPTGILNSNLGLRLGDNDNEIRTLLFFSDSPSASTINNFTLASGLPTDMRLQDMVVFVYPPE
ncbi:MAG: tandem-95 repeat protein [Desulfuromonadales bacterium]|nr:tandem-95 repeat protein [Desulfuromonadales bacterium]